MKRVFSLTMSLAVLVFAMVNIVACGTNEQEGMYNINFGNYIQFYTK